MKIPLSRPLCALVTATVLGSSLAAPIAQAGMVGTAAVAERAELAQQRAQLKELLAREDVREQLIAWGVEPAAAQTRVDSLSPQELQQMAQKMDELPAGGDILGAAVFVFLVLLVTDILGFTDIFPFVRKPDER
jgi:hypothetical protein